MNHPPHMISRENQFFPFSLDINSSSKGNTKTNDKYYPTPSSHPPAQSSLPPTTHYDFSTHISPSPLPPPSYFRKYLFNPQADVPHLSSFNDAPSPDPHNHFPPSDSPPFSSPTNKIPQRLAVVSMNICGASFNAHNFIKFSSAMAVASVNNADVVLFQETHSSIADALNLLRHNHHYWWTICEGDGRSRGVITGLKKSKFDKPHPQSITRDRIGRWCCITTPSRDGTLYQISNFYLPHFIQELTMKEFDHRVPLIRDAIQIAGGDFNHDSRRSDFSWLHDWADKRSSHFIFNEIPTWRNTSIIDHICIDDRLPSNEVELAVLPGNGHDHSIVLFKCSKDKANKTLFPNPRIDDRFAKSSVVHNEAIFRIGERPPGADPLEYLIKFVNTSRDIIVSDAKIIDKEADRDELNALVRCLRVHPSQVSANDKKFPSVASAIEAMKNVHCSKKKFLVKWKSFIRVSISDFRKEYGIPINHLFPKKTPKLPRFHATKNYVLVDHNRVVIEEGEKAAAALHSTWKNILGKKRNWNRDILDSLIDAHPKLFGPFPQEHEVNTTLLDEILQANYSSSQGDDGTPFSLLTSSYHLLRDTWIEFIRNMAKGFYCQHSELGNTLLNLIPKKEGMIETSDFRPIAVTNTIYRIAMKYWAKVIAEIVEPLISEPQRALLRGRTIHQAVTAVHDTFVNRVHNRLDTIFLQTDFSKAFDYVNRKALIRTLKRLNLPSFIINVARTALADNRMTLVSSNPQSFRGVTGVRQGCPVSPLLYLIIVDLLVHQLKDIDGIICIQAYADDNGLILDGVRALPKIFYTIKVYEAATGAELNVKKSSMMGWTKKRISIPREWKDINIVDESKYLGITIAKIPSSRKTWGDAINKISNAASFIKKTRCGFRMKIELINTYIVPTLQYISSFALMDFEVQKCIWGHIRRCLGSKGMSRHVLITKFQSLSIKPAIMDPYCRNIASLLSKPPSDHKGPISPHSIQFTRLVALKHFKEIVKDSDPAGFMYELLGDRERFFQWASKVGWKKVCLNIYNLCVYSPRHPIIPNLFNDLQLSHPLALYWVPRNIRFISNPNHKNAFILLLNKCWATDSKIDAINRDREVGVCKFCRRTKMTHKHLIAECDVIEWVYGNPLGHPLWPKSPSDILCCTRPLSANEVKVRAAILHCIFTGLQTDLNGPSLTNHIAAVLRAMLKDIDERKSNWKEKEVPKKHREKPPLSKYAHEMFFDGSADPNNLNGGYGYSILVNGNEVVAHGEALGNCTINEAEGLGAINGMRAALGRGILELSVKGDSKTIINMCEEDAPCLSPNLFWIYCEIQRLRKLFSGIEFIFTPREYNSRADVVAFTSCNAIECLPEITKEFTIVRPQRADPKITPHILPVPKFVKNPAYDTNAIIKDNLPVRSNSLTSRNNGSWLEEKDSSRKPTSSSKVKSHLSAAFDDPIT
jgi:ribonuclease HI